MKKYFEQPEIAVTKLDVEDIITVSGGEDVTEPSKPADTLPVG